MLHDCLRAGVVRSRSVRKMAAQRLQIAFYNRAGPLHECSIERMKHTNVCEIRLSSLLGC